MMATAGGDPAAARAALDRFMGFLTIRSTSAEGPSGPYADAVAYLRGIAEGAGFATKVVSYVPNKPVLIVSWPGRDPSLPSVLLNSHYDVVPAQAECWESDPFKPREAPDGKIYARGTQDMKCVCMQNLEALCRLKRAHPEGSPFLRSIHLSFLPDEEVGGNDGAGRFTRSEDFAALKVGVALDEGLASPTDAFTVFFGERAAWFFSVKATGPTGHGSRFIPNPATHKVVKVINKALEFRAEQEARLDPGCSHGVAKKLGDVVSLNVTALKAGLPGPPHFGNFALNVVPPEAEAGFDVRIPPSVPVEQMEQKLKDWASADEGVSVHYHAKVAEHHVTSTDAAQNPWWGVFSGAFHANGWKYEPEVFPAATDSRYLRALGIPCFGFSPMNNTPILLHDHNEFIHRDVYLRGIDIYVELVRALADAPATVDRAPAAPTV